MRVKLISIPVTDQEKGLEFYTKKLGFLIKKNETLPNGHRWITLVSEDDEEGPELLLEPSPLHFAPSKDFQDALREAGIPYTQFDVDDLDKEYNRLKELDVEFSVAPTVYQQVKYAILSDTCGNHIQLVQTL
jgi:catechol 2,3-dioxygenase-like lactoylglutathione lyase family enzyme